MQPVGSTGVEHVEPKTLRLVARSVTHELRQPLSLITGYAELLTERSSPSTVAGAMLAEIRAAAAHLAAALDLLEHTRDVELVSFGPEEERRVIDLRPARRPCP